MSRSVSIDIGSQGPVQRRRFAINRMWNQLTRLQKSAMSVCLVLAMLLVIGFARNDPRHGNGMITIASDRTSSPLDALLLRRSERERELELQHRNYEKRIDALQIENDLLKKRFRNGTATRLLPSSSPLARQRPPKSDDAPSTTRLRQRAVVDAFRHAWSAYRRHAWGHDELKPVSKSYSEWFHLGLTIIDSLDTMWIMGLRDEFDVAREWVAKELNFDHGADVNLFEVTIRVLGGLISAYHLSGDDMFKEKATDLGERLLGSFSSPSGIPYSDVNLKTRVGRAPRWGPDSSVSEVTTIQMEFRELSRMTGDPKYQKAADSVLDLIQTLNRPHDLVPIFVNANSGQFRSGATITVGARGDSYYEYLLKQWLQSGKKETKFKDWFVASVEGMKKELIRTSKPDDLLYIGELLRGKNFSPKMDHLTCFMAGTLALASHHGLDAEYMELGEKLAYTCYQMYERMPTGLSPEIAYFQQTDTGRPHSDIIVKPADAHNLLRPETLESLFILYRLTRDSKYQEWGWKIFQAFEKHTKVENGYTSIHNVMSTDTRARDKMESFFLGETLKYLFLLFEEDFDVISLDKYVLNTEAHPFPIWKGD